MNSSAGISLGFTPADVSNLVELLRWRATYQPDNIGYSFLKDGEVLEGELTYAELDKQAKKIACLLKQVTNERECALLLYPPSLEYIASFFGCLYAGVIAVPTYPPKRNRSDSRLQTIITDSQAGIVLTTANILADRDNYLEYTPELAQLNWLATDSIETTVGQQWQAPDISGHSIAFLQYTSGSTNNPKGVMVSHSNLLHNNQLIKQRLELLPDSRLVSWLPPYHDMGLIGNILQPLYSSFPILLMTPAAFLQKPYRWLKAMSDIQATNAVAPNFAYELCVHKITPEQRATLDLSHWRAALNGAEPVRDSTLQLFAKTFAPNGFKLSAFIPVYGLAECTLMVSGPSRDAPHKFHTVMLEALQHNRVRNPSHPEESAETLVSCGKPGLNTRVVIVNPETLNRCAPDEVGEIWIDSPSVAQGYWRNPEQTRRTFQAYLKDTGEGPFLRTGDLGFLNEGDLYITGRLKDVIIIRGKNHYPQDIEKVVAAAHPSTLPDAVAAFSVTIADEEQLVIAVEVERRYQQARRQQQPAQMQQNQEHRHLPDRRKVNLATTKQTAQPTRPPFNPQEVIAAIQHAVAEHHGLQSHAVVLLRVGSIPKTTSGKIQRYACRKAFLDNTLIVVGRSETQQLDLEQRELTLSCEMLLQKSEAERQALIEDYLRQFMARLLKIAPAQLETTPPLIQYGIDSILALECQHKVESHLNIQFPVSKLLDGISITQLATEVRQQLQDPQVCLKPLASHDSVTQYPLSYNQQALWFLYKFAPQSTAYNIFFAAHIHSMLDIEVVKKILDILVQRHPALRTTYGLKQGQALQQIHSELPYEFKALDTSYWSQKQIKQYLTEEAHKPFNLETGPLLRVHVLKRLQDKHILFWNIHHIITDMWSMMVLLEEFSELYVQYLRKLPYRLPEASNATYTDYVQWQTEMLASEQGRKLWMYWRDKLSGELPTLNLPTDHPRPPTQQFVGERYAFKLDWNLTEQLKQLGQARNTTLYTILLATFGVLLHRYTGQEDIIIGSVMAGRNYTVFNKLFGYLVNPVALRVDFTGNPAFEDFLMQTRQTVLEALEHQAYPFQLLVQKLQPARDASRSPLFSVLFSLQQPPKIPETAPFILHDAGAKVHLGSLELESIHIPQQVTQFDMTLLIAESTTGLIGAWEYDTALFEEHTLEKMTEHYTALLQSIVNNFKQKVGLLPLLTKVEQHQLRLWNDDSPEYANNKTLVEMFETQVQTTPDAIALIFETQQLTYAQLNAKANQLAHHLLQHAAIKDVYNPLVAVYVDRSLELIVTLLAVLKAGAAYVPIDPTYPKARVLTILADSGVQVILTHTALQGNLSLNKEEQAVKIVYIDNAACAEYVTTNPNVVNPPDSIAYVIYTSGSTGKPKGCLVSNYNVQRLFAATEYWFNFNSDDVWTLFHSYAFDFSVWEIWGALLHGGKLIIVPYWVSRSPEDFYQLLLQHHVTVLNQTPLAFQQLIQVDRQINHELALRYIIFGGEALDRNVLEPWFAKNGDEKPQLINMYGITETTVHVTYYPLKQHDNSFGSIIGKPIPDLSVYLLDANQQPVPIGVVGEMYVSGAGVSQGYLNRPELTAERFIELDIFAKTERSYKTGDLARWLPNGQLEYFGRSDNQIKLRGFRIELGEIERTLTQHEWVNNALVRLGQHSVNQQLIAYIIAADNAVALKETTLFEQLRAYLANYLPEYMVPAAFIKLDSFPLTANNKIDRKALPEPNLALSNCTYSAPRNDEERYLVEVWENVLKHHPISIDDNFFELGGDSILTIQIVARAKKLGLGFTAQDIFEHQTIAELATFVQHVNIIEAEQGILTGNVPLTPIQQHFFKLQTPIPSYFNQAILLKVPTDLPERVYQNAFGTLLNHHDALRLRFEKNADTWRQYYSEPSDTLPFHSEDLREFPALEQMSLLEQRAERYQRSLDLSQGPLTRLVLFRLSTANYLFWVIHHLVVDGVSWRILLNDLQTACQQFAQDKPVKLPLKTTAYQYWANRLLDYQPTMPPDYWQQLSSQPVLADQTEHNTPQRDTAKAMLTLEKETTHALLTDTAHAYNTQIDDLLIMALLQTLQHWNQQTEWVLDIESHGRAALFDDIDISRTVGWFTSLYPIHLHVPPEEDLATRLKSIKEQLRAITDAGIDYGVWRYLHNTPLPQGQLVFKYLGEFNLTADSGFAFVDMPILYDISPDMPRQHPLEINSYISDGQLKCIWIYNRQQYPTATIEALMAVYQQSLTTLISHCQQQTKLSYTPSDFPLAQLSQAAVDIITAPYDSDLLNLYPLSPAQQVMTEATQQHLQTGIYVEQFYCDLRGQLDPQRLQTAWQLLINRHDILRTAFVLEANPPLQVVYKTVTLPWQSLDWSSASIASQQQQFTEQLARERQQGFQLNQAPLTQCTLIKLGAEHYRLVWTSHHALLDGWCLSILFKELVSLYRDGAQALLSHPEPYHDYIAWLQQQDLSSAETYWHTKLHDFKAPTPLPLATAATGQPLAHQHLRVPIASALTQQLHQFAQHHQLTLNNLVQSAWALLLSHYSGHTDIVFGMTSSGRHIDLFGINNRIGLFINSLPLRLKIDDTPLLAWLKDLQTQQQTNISYYYASLQLAHACSGVAKSQPLFESLLIFENYPLDTSFTQGNEFVMEQLEMVGYNHYPLALFVIPHETVFLQLAYDSQRFDATAIQTLLDTLQALLATLVTQPATPISQLLADFATSVQRI